MAVLHFSDFRRPIGEIVTGGRPDGTGYRSQVIQYPVICSLNYAEEHVTLGSTKPVTDDVRRVGCPDCREVLQSCR